MNDLLNPGYHEVETGYCNLPNGSGYAAYKVMMPGVTSNMINWWFAWHGLEALRYKIWWPKGHCSVSISAEERKIVLDPNRSLTEKFEGITHHVVEDIGSGKEDIFINFLSPEDMGFDMSRFKAPFIAGLVAANGLSGPVGAPLNAPKNPAVMCHVVREIQGGIELRSRFWCGYNIVNKKPQLLLSSGAKIPAGALYGLCEHGILEMSRLRAILPQIYEEQKGIVS
jgi:hypothetical protein